jgi:2-polyprenyl-3-methyl-5-hydroxy-6-metoxy-1,4-benzoquinol methylase
VTLSLWKCADCGFIFAEGQELDHLTALYERLSDRGYEDSQDGRVFQMRWLLQAARRAHPAAISLLDIGAGTGLLVAEGRRLGLDAVGVEPSRSLADVALHVNGVDVRHGVWPHPSLAHRAFDLVFLIDVIEHVAQPVDLLRRCRDALAPGGLLIVVTPDVGSIPARILGHRWWHFRLAHVGYFDRRSFGHATERTGLSIRREFRAVWFLRVGYVADRLASYLPVARLNALARRVPILREIYDRVIALNPRDSLVVFLTRKENSP